jgi:hypothetical protein
MSIKSHADNNKERTANARKTKAETIVSIFTMNSEVMRNNDWKVDDVMSFQRKVILEGIMDKLDYVINGISGSKAYVVKQRNRVETSRKRFNGDELSTMFLKGALAESRAAGDKDQMLQDMLSGLQQSYIADHGDEYVPYGRRKDSNVRIDAKVEVPDDIAAELEAGGFETTVGTVQNTDGVDTVQ